MVATVGWRYQDADRLLKAALVLSMLLHVSALKLLPGFWQEAHKPVQELAVELLPLPRKPLPPPAPSRLEPEKPKPQSKKWMQPITQPAVQQTTELAPQPVRTVESSPLPQVIAAEPKPADPPPAVTAPSPPIEPTPKPIVESPPKPVAVSQDLDAARNSYGSQLFRELAKYKQYPRLAQMKGWQGIVKLELQMDASGNVASSNILESSGYEALDKQALEMLRKATPLPLPPEALRGKEFKIVIPIAFKME